MICIYSSVVEQPSRIILRTAVIINNSTAVLDCRRRVQVDALQHEHDERVRVQHICSVEERKEAGRRRGGTAACRTAVAAAGLQRRVLHA